MRVQVGADPQAVQGDVVRGVADHRDVASGYARRTPGDELETRPRRRPGSRSAPAKSSSRGGGARPPYAAAVDRLTALRAPLAAVALAVLALVAAARVGLGLSEVAGRAARGRWPPPGWLRTARRRPARSWSRVPGRRLLPGPPAVPRPRGGSRSWGAVLVAVVSLVATGGGAAAGHGPGGRRLEPGLACCPTSPCRCSSASASSRCPVGRRRPERAVRPSTGAGAGDRSGRPAASRPTRSSSRPGRRTRRRGGLAHRRARRPGGPRRSGWGSRRTTRPGRPRPSPRACGPGRRSELDLTPRLDHDRPVSFVTSVTGARHRRVSHSCLSQVLTGM